MSRFLPRCAYLRLSKSHGIGPCEGAYRYVVLVWIVILLADEHLFTWLKSMEERILLLEPIHEFDEIQEIFLLELDL